MNSLIQILLIITFLWLFLVLYHCYIITEDALIKNIDKNINNKTLNKISKIFIRVGLDVSIIVLAFILLASLKYILKIDISMIQHFLM